MAVLRSTIFALLFYPATALFSLAAVLAAMFGRNAVTRVPLAWAHYHRWCARLILGIRTRVEGRIPDRSVLVASKHQSMYETLELMILLDRPVPVVKRELADLPLWGWAARRYGVIAVDREGGAKTLRHMLAAASAATSEGRQVLIFPEGTRVATGEQPPLQPGFAGLYRALKLPVVPVALDSGRLWPRHRFVKRPGVITMRFADPIAANLSRQDIERAVHAAINALESVSP
jgi:1-acyl-sn-glycerol-3-phosphate acyltransferase